MKLATVRKFALSLPGVTEQPHFHFGSFRVNGKIFVTFPPEGGHVHLFVSELEREQALALHPQFAERLFWGAKVVGLRVTLAAAPPATLKRLVRQAWTNKAPRAMRDAFPSGAGAGHR